MTERHLGGYDKTDGGYISVYASDGSLRADSQRSDICLSPTWQREEGDILESLELV